MTKCGYVYILTNSSNKVLYVGVTSNLEKRISQHREKEIPGFTQKYHLHKLVYFEQHDSIEDAIKREKQLKNWHRKWKIALITKNNPHFKDISLDAESSSA